MTAAPNTLPLRERFAVDSIAESVVACLRDRATADQLLAHIADRMIVAPERAVSTVDGALHVAINGACVRIPHPIGGSGGRRIALTWSVGA